jgi:hypothetical protein
MNLLSSLGQQIVSSFPHKGIAKNLWDLIFFSYGSRFNCKYSYRDSANNLSISEEQYFCLLILNHSIEITLRKSQFQMMQVSGLFIYLFFQHMLCTHLKCLEGRLEILSWIR